MTSRRSFLVGLGSLAAGGAVAVGSGAFSATSAEREARINVVADDRSLVTLESGLASDTVRVDESSGGLVIDTSLGGKTGINTDSVYQFGELEQLDFTEIFDFDLTRLVIVFWVGTHWIGGRPAATDMSLGIALNLPESESVESASQASKSVDAGRPELAASDDECAFRVTNNDTTSHDIQLTIPNSRFLDTDPDEVSPVSNMSFPDVGPNETVAVSFAVVTGHKTVETELAGDLGVSVQ
jgi:hypothetical protein